MIKGDRYSNGNDDQEIFPLNLYVILIWTYFIFKKFTDQKKIANLHYQDLKYEFAISFSNLWSQSLARQLWSMRLCIIWFNRRSIMSIVVVYLCNLIRLHLINQFNYYELTWFSIAHQWWWWWWQYLTIFHISLTEMYWWRMEARQREGVYREIWVVNHVYPCNGSGGLRIEYVACIHIKSKWMKWSDVYHLYQ